MDVIIPTTLGASTFTRSTVAQYYDSNGLIATAAINTSRGNYNPTNLSAAPTPLLENSSINNALSENFLFTSECLATHASFEYNAIAAPDGKISADKLVEDATNNPHTVIVNPSGSETTGTATYSIFAKAGERSVLQLTMSIGSDIWRFDLAAGTVSGTPTTTTASIFNSGNGWYRCIFTYPRNGTNNAIQLALVSGGNTTYTGTIGSGLYLWGSQGEQQTTATSYIRTIPTFTSRASSATFINASGVITTASTNIARQTYNPDNLTIPSRLLLEPAATNICKQSQTFSTSPWATTASLTASQPGPDGSSTSAFTIADASGSVLNVLTQPITVANDSAGYVFSFYIKKTTTATTFPGLEMKFSGGTGKDTSITFNTNTGTYVANAAATNTAAYVRVDSVLNFWRVSIGLYNNSTGNTTLTVNVYPAVNTDASGTWAVATTGSIVGFGAQVEAAALGFGALTQLNLTRTSYIVTTTTSVTRAADVYSWGATTRAADSATTGLFYTNIPENDFPAWSSGTTYGVDVSGSNSVVYNHVKYASLQASNVGHQPDISPTWWSVIGATNAYAMIDTQVGTQTIASAIGGRISTGFKIGVQPSLSFLNVIADSIVITIYSNYLPMYTTTLDMTGGSTGVPITDWTLTGLTTYSDAYVTLDIYSASQKAAIGNFVIGTKYYLGSTETSPTVGIIDYSIKTVDAFGNPTLTKRGYAKRMGVKTLVDDAQVDVVSRLMAQVRATPCVWNGNTNMVNFNSNQKSSLIVYGYYKDWEIDCAFTQKSYLTATIEGLI